MGKTLIIGYRYLPALAVRYGLPMAAAILTLVALGGSLQAEPGARLAARITAARITAAQPSPPTAKLPGERAPVVKATPPESIQVTSAESPGKLPPPTGSARTISVARVQPTESLPPAPPRAIVPPTSDERAEQIGTPTEEELLNNNRYRKGNLYRGYTADPNFFADMTDEERRKLFDNRDAADYGIARSLISPEETQPDDVAAVIFSHEPSLASTYGFQRNWQPSLGLWESPAFFHRPLYFEEVNLERYGHRHPFLQPGLSAAHFVGNAIALPYKMGVNHPCERIYTLGHYRPGDCNPHDVHGLPWSWRGAAYTGAFYTGAVFVLP